MNKNKLEILWQIVFVLLYIMACITAAGVLGWLK